LPTVFAGGGDDVSGLLEQQQIPEVRGLRAQASQRPADTAALIPVRDVVHDFMSSSPYRSLRLGPGVIQGARELDISVTARPLPTTSLSESPGGSVTENDSGRPAGLDQPRIARLTDPIELDVESSLREGTPNSRT
jgi:hypothetical protein